MPSVNEIPEKPWSSPSDDILRHFAVDREQGLSPEQIEKRRRQFGPNRLREKKKTSPWKILANQFASLIVALLGLASLLAFFFGKWVEGIAIGVALIINAVIGFVTELKAARSMEALQSLGQVDAKVRREGRVETRDAENLVPGDIVIIEAGDLISADLRLIEANNLQIDEAALTGESMTVSKQAAPVAHDTPLAERTSMLFKGTSVTAGSGEAVVTATGMKTELGTIASLTAEAEDESTPLEKRLERLGRKLVWVTLAMGLLVALAGFIGGKPWLLVIEIAIAMAVAAVPEGLPIVATIALARGMWRMARRNALINRLSAVETLGATTIVCTDKTGTLTANRMAVTRLVLADEQQIAVDKDREPHLQSNAEPISLDAHPLLRRAVAAAVLCNNAELGGDDDQAVGDPMEVALLELGRICGLERRDLLEECPEEREVAFSAETKMMATYHVCGKNRRVAVKGAVERVLATCSRVAGAEESGELSDDLRERWRERNRNLAEEGLRVLALADKEIGDPEEEAYDDLVFLGLLGMWDPPRDSARQALQACHDAGIRVIMVTGDHPVTAGAVAREIGLFSAEQSAVIAGGELEDLDGADEQRREQLRATDIFARVSPAQKLKLIKLHQDHGAIVAMTGDGVNDAPALKKADIGVAMGERGTQVAKEAADMVLQDDEFATIVTAVRYGRVIFGNIRKFIYFLLSGNISEILIITLAALVGAPLPLLPLQILYLNLIGDVFPALALGVGEGDPSVMKQPPRDPSEPVLTRRHWFGIGGYSLVIAAAVLGAFAIALEGMQLPADQAVTISFTTLALARLWHVFNMRDTNSPLVRNEITRNPFVWAALGICLAILLGGLLQPGLAGILGLVAPDAQGWALILSMSLIPLIVGQIVKLLAKSGILPST